MEAILFPVFRIYHQISLRICSLFKGDFDTPVTELWGKYDGSAWP